MYVQGDGTKLFGKSELKVENTRWIHVLDHNKIKKSGQ